MEKKNPGFIEDLNRYTQRFVLCEDEKFKEEFHYNILRIEKDQPNIDVERVKEEIINKAEVFRNFNYNFTDY